jgi:hypothetical protein
MTTMQRTQQAWNRAREALDAACSELAAVPGAGDEYDAMCKAVSNIQAEGNALIKAAGHKFEAAR